MFGKEIPLFTLFGFRVSIDPSWFLLLVLIVWSLAKGYFPEVIETIAPEMALWLAVAGAFGLFASIVFHEFAHSLVARQFGMPITGITLFLFGGIAKLRDEPPSARAEFLVAIAGPLSSFFLTIVFYLLYAAVRPGEDAMTPLAALFRYLATINFALATFNLLPAFPLDGGRVLRAAVWGWTGSLSRATEVGAALGRGLGAAMMVFGVMTFVTGGFAGGLWFSLIGFFIFSAARSTELQAELEQALKGVLVRDIMNRRVIPVPADLSVAELVEDYFYRQFHKCFPVVRAGRVIGSVQLQDVRDVPREEWGRTRVAEILKADNTRRLISAGATVVEAMSRMRAANVSRLIVVEHGELAGMLTMRDLTHFLAVRRELREPESAPAQHRPLGPDQ
ncbi:MAG: site-2 protease family protein [Roseibium sp.]